MIQQELIHKINNKTKPIHSLGKLENIALKIGTIQNTLTPTIQNPMIIIFAGDHGIAKTNLVNVYPQEVTAQMVLNFINGGAAINIFCEENNIILKIVDTGVNFSFDPSLPIISKKINYGTKNYLETEAMTFQEVENCFNNGKMIIQSLLSKYKTNCFGFGEMGISNTSSASLITSIITKMNIDTCIGKGTGSNKEQLRIKKETLTKVYNKHYKENMTPIEILTCFGGFEIATMVGAYIETAKNKKIIIVDGFISTAAFLVAQQIEPSIIDYCIFSHISAEQAHQSVIEYLKVDPILNLNLCLGEGTGVALAMPIIKNACAFINKMASFEQANVSKSNL